MIDESVVKHYEHVCRLPFDDVIVAFEAAVGNGDDGKFLNGMRALTRAEDWERLCKASFGPSGFLHVLTFDHGHWMGLYGTPAKAKQYAYGNPLIAHTMVKHDIGVCNQVPLRVLFYEAADGRTRIAYDLPSSLLARLHNAEIDAIARTLDAKVIAFATELAGNPA